MTIYVSCRSMIQCYIPECNNIIYMQTNNKIYKHMLTIFLIEIMFCRYKNKLFDQNAREVWYTVISKKWPKQEITTSSAVVSILIENNQSNICKHYITHRELTKPTLTSMYHTCTTEPPKLSLCILSLTGSHL